MVIFNLFDRIFCLGISLLVFQFFSSLNSFNSSRGSCYFYYAGGGFTLFGCNWFQSTTTNLSVERQRPHPYYWNLPRPCNSWFELHFHRRNIPEEFFYRQMRMSRDTFGTLLTTLRHKLMTKGRHSVEELHPTRKCLGQRLYRVAHGGSFENTGIARNVGKTTACEAFTNVCTPRFQTRFHQISI